jgi:hypothetical protein
VDREQPLARMISMEQVAENSVANRRLSMLLLTLFAGVAMEQSIDKMSAEGLLEVRARRPLAARLPHGYEVAG